jgi:hypothetical protein
MPSLYVLWPDGQQPGARSSRMKWVALACAALLLSAVLVGQSQADDNNKAARAIFAEVKRLRAAVEGYVRDTGELPPAVFDLGAGYDGGLSDVANVPWRLRDAWHGPYLQPRPRPPLSSCFWSLAEPCHMQDGDGDGEADEVWARVHRGEGVLDDQLAALLDAALDDAVSTTGVVRVTPAWVWIQLIER